VGVRTPTPRAEWEQRPARFAPRASVALGLGALVFALLLSNGRPIPSGDTRPSERVAASLVTELDFDLDEFPDVEPPFAREVAGRRVSIYPVLSPLLAAPVFAAAGTVFRLDEQGLSFAGKLAAALFSAVAAALMFLFFGRRHGEHAAFAPALLFALGTSVWSTSQALWQHPAAVLFLALALLFTLRAEDDEAWAERAGLPLGLALAARPADVMLVGALGLGLALRFPRRLPRLLLWSLPGVVFTLAYQWAYFGSPLRHGFSGSTAQRFSAAWGEGHLGLLLSPAKGLFVFTPLALVGLFGLGRALRAGERGLALTCGLGALAHWLLMGRWSEWHGGACFGPRLMTDALPLLLAFLPEGLARAGRLGTLLAAISVAVQALGAFTYDLRWERLYQRDPASTARSLWSVADAPLPFHAFERVLKPALPAVRDGRLLLREYPFVVAAPGGSRVAFVDARLRLTGSESTVTDVHLQRGARVDGTTLRLSGRWDALFARVRGGARQRRLELRVRGRGQGTLYVGERSFWSPTPRWTAYPMGGAFRVRHPYSYAQSGGGDLLVSLGKTGGEASLDQVALVPPSEPERVIETP
jgi:hypothetical protein